ncbi:unnamed protein product [Cuscuta epithymum]|uniref:Alpha N-terminal protein methyltransferase 1 n=1 Tax=Cuscuta epithymum TaxID=186058 RepID=A0AAV0CJX4_9ASTE|nr:unnamed protein product [Cuscuta epithymum]
MDAGGLDSEGRDFRNAEEMWREVAGDDGSKSQWYSSAIRYWENVEATVDGVLGGYGNVNDADVAASNEFLTTILAERFPAQRDAASPASRIVALDCGSGIGRVTKNVLIRHFNEVDLLEPVPHFLEAARASLAPENLTAPGMNRVANFFCIPLQDFTPEAGRYDVIWVQWCINQLFDDDFIAFFKRARIGLKPGGLFVLKENIAKGDPVLDNTDKSITRSDKRFKELFDQCGLFLYKTKDQKGFPVELFAVKMYALTTEMPKPRRSFDNRRKSKRLSNQPAIIKEEI